METGFSHRPNITAVQLSRVFSCEFIHHLYVVLYVHQTMVEHVDHIRPRASLWLQSGIKGPIWLCVSYSWMQIHRLSQTLMSTIIDTTKRIAVPIHYKTDKSTDCQAQLQKWKYQHNGMYINIQRLFATIHISHGWMGLHSQQQQQNFWQSVQLLKNHFTNHYISYFNNFFNVS